MALGSPTAALLIVHENEIFSRDAIIEEQNSMVTLVIELGACRENILQLLARHI